MSDFQKPGAPVALATGPARTPERVRTEIGLLLLVLSEVGATIMTPLRAFTTPHLITPVFTYEIDLAIAIVLILLFSAGGGLVVIGRRPFGPAHSKRSVLGLGLWIGVTVFDLFLFPYSLPIVGGPVLFGIVFTMEGIVESAIVVAATVLLTYSLQSSNGKRLLWLGSIIGLGLDIAFDSQNLRVFPYYPALVQRTILAFDALSTLLFAAAFLVALSRVRGGTSSILAERTRLEKKNPRKRTRPDFAFTFGSGTFGG